MRLLIIDNNIDPDSWGARNLRRYLRLVPEATAYVRRAPHDDLPRDPRNFDRVIISGSKTSALDDAPWISRLHDFIQRTLDLRKPLLGVCYGHQSLARVIGGKAHVRRAAEAEFGWTTIEITEPSPLMEGLPQSFYSFSSHFDEVGELPKGLKRLARSESCEVQAFQVEKYPAFGIQFHPEKDLASAEATLAERKRLGIPDRLLYPNKGKELYNSRIGDTIFGNFFKL
ncbi:MAG: hypothetical protein A2428_17330 [Bdellovibrionales bacterium RIFOXYC1_FULL_54_43]|nr:MAG: hypothetical protein A2428_17330 [Bdellovibrionales bacterium RIFOXYC1_FULL_54_43]OFZ80781.1 MAG: hypothetical protein A2603_11285 [Bdellovibrionales bacterium RIFOXYD1_FULL_55_31]